MSFKLIWSILDRNGKNWTLYLLGTCFLITPVTKAIFSGMYVYTWLYFQNRCLNKVSLNLTFLSCISNAFLKDTLLGHVWRTMPNI